MNYKRTQLRSLILSDLGKGVLNVGDQLPTEAEMIQKYSMSRATVREGIALLVQEGILSRRRGAGTFVNRLKPVAQGKMIAALIQCSPGQWDSFGQLAHQIEQRVHEQGNSLILCNHECRKDKLEAHLQRIIDGGIASIVANAEIIADPTNATPTANRSRALHFIDERNRILLLSGLLRLGFGFGGNAKRAFDAADRATDCAANNGSDSAANRAGRLVSGP
jgi:hypothetical protein